MTFLDVEPSHHPLLRAIMRAIAFADEEALEVHSSQ
jgi:hypothetical protein